MTPIAAPDPARAPLRVILANPRGFCAGVIRAIEIVERALDRFGAPVYVRHEIVHNRHVVDRLRARGAVFVEDVAEIPAGAPTIFSAHGVSRAIEAEARARGLPVLDATCPLVSKVHVQARRYARMGRVLVLIGHASHAEVAGTIGQVDGRVHVVASVADVATLPIAAEAPVAYVTQTTLSVDDTRAVIDALSARFADLIGPDTSEICYATQNRQRAVRDIARASDLLIVVGAANSSNSNRLREIGEELGVPSHLVADGAAIDPAWLPGVGTIALTAGASAPEVLVDDVLATLARHRSITVEQHDGIKEDIVFGLPAELRGETARARDDFSVAAS